MGDAFAYVLERAHTTIVGPRDLELTFFDTFPRQEHFMYAVGAARQLGIKMNCNPSAKVNVVFTRSHYVINVNGIKPKPATSTSNNNL